MRIETGLNGGEFLGLQNVAMRVERDMARVMKMIKRISFAGVLALALTAIAAPPAAWDKKAPENKADLLQIQQQVAKVLVKVRAATVAVRAGGGSGSGVIITADGLVLTAGHVSGTPGRKFEVILADGRKFEGQALGNSVATDSGMIRILKPKDLPVVSYALPSMPETGTWVLAVGNPGGWDDKRGSVFRLGRIISTTRDTLRTDCKLLGGDSGGPLFDLNGTVVGIHSRISSRPDQNYHVAMISFHDDWKPLADGKTIKPIDESKRGYLGLIAADHPAGARVNHVVEDSPAAKAGVVVGDVITHINDKKIFGGESVRHILNQMLPDETVVLTIEREGKSKAVTIKLTKKPASDLPKEEPDAPLGPLNPKKGPEKKNPEPPKKDNP